MRAVAKIQPLLDEIRQMRDELERAEAKAVESEEKAAADRKAADAIKSRVAFALRVADTLEGLVSELEEEKSVELESLQSQLCGYAAEARQITKDTDIFDDLTDTLCKGLGCVYEVHEDAEDEVVAEEVHRVA